MYFPNLEFHSIVLGGLRQRDYLWKAQESRVPQHPVHSVDADGTPCRPQKNSFLKLSGQMNTPGLLVGM
jgi:hypothetical protein